MSLSPLITPGNRRPSGRRRRWAALAGLLALAAIAAAVVVLLVVHGHGSASSRRAGGEAGASALATPRRAGSRAPGSSAPVSASSGVSPSSLSPSGLHLGKPALALRGLGAPSQDALQIGFRRPPRAGLLFNLNTGAVLWQRNALRRLRIASLNKMMTALIAARYAPGTPVLVTKQAIEAPGSKVGVLPRGRRVRLETMLYGLLLPSGNDAAVALAQTIAGTVGAFVARMNAEAAHLGLACTRYSSPSGFLDEGNFSCPADLAVLAHADLVQPRVASIVRTLSAVLPFPIKGGKLYLYNNNPLLINRYPGLTGVKTGYTDASGRCLVATAQRHGVRLGVVLLHSPAPANQARQLLDLGFGRVYHQPPAPELPLAAEA